MTFDWSEDVMVFCFFILFICLEPTVRKCIWMRKISVTVMVIFWKCHPENYYVRSSFSTIMRHICNSILKDNPQLKILRTWINICVNSFIKTWEKIMKRNSKKLPGKLQVAQKSESALRATLHQNRSHFTYFYKLLFLSSKSSF